MKDFQNAARASFITSIAQVISAMISLFSENGLTLVDALVVTSVTSLVMAYLWLRVVVDGSFFVRHVHQNKFKVTWELFATGIVYTSLWMSFGIIVWWDPVNFGNSANQNCSSNPNQDVVFWLLGHSVPVTNTGMRTLAMFSFIALGVLTIGRTVARFWFTGLYMQKVEERGINIVLMELDGPPKDGSPLPTIEGHPTNSVVQPAVVPGPAPAADGMTPADLFSHSPVQTHLVDPEAQLPEIPEVNEGRLRRPLRLRAREVAPLLSYLCRSLVFPAYIYLIVTTESMITINGQRATTSQLTFGQIFSLVSLLEQMIFSPITQVSSALLNAAESHLQGKRASDLKQCVQAQPDASLRVNPAGGVGHAAEPPNDVTVPEVANNATPPETPNGVTTPESSSDAITPGPPNDATTHESFTEEEWEEAVRHVVRSYVWSDEQMQRRRRRLG